MTSLILPPVFPPPWAGGWGEDARGVYADIVIEGVVLEMRWIPRGTFRMGSLEEENGRDDDEGPQHEVEISRGYWLGETPVTQAQWQAVMGGNPSEFKGAENPVEKVSWEECGEYTAKLNAMMPGLGARLPSEAEWEYACRAGTTAAFNNGADCTKPEGEDPALSKLGWYGENSGHSSHAVGQKRPNDWGLYDMHGNVWEWCEDWFGSYGKREELDPTGPETGDGRVVRGGCWDGYARCCRSACRNWGHPSDRFNGRLGFRLAAGPELKNKSTGGRV